MGQVCTVGGPPAEEHVLNHGDPMDLMFAYNPKEGAPNGNNFHAVTIKGFLDEGRLRRAVDALQERHPRMRAKMYMNPWSQYNYLIETAERVPLLVKSGSYKTLNLDLEEVLMRDIDCFRGPFCHFTYVRHEEEGTGLLVFANNHGVGDGRCCEILLSQLLRLYDGQEVGHFKTCTSMLQVHREVQTEQLKAWWQIESQMPARDIDSITETFVDPLHQDYLAKFEGVCLEVLHFEPDDTHRFLQQCRAERTTVTSAMAAAIQYAILAELLERGRKTEFVNIGFDMNLRGRQLGKEYDEECGNFVYDTPLRIDFEDQFWDAARKFNDLVKQILDTDCGLESMMAANGDEMLTRDALFLLKEIASLEALATQIAEKEHCNMSSLGVLKRFGKYADFEVLENYTGSNIAFLPCKMNVCTSGSSGRLSVCIMVAKNVVPHCRQLARSLRDRVQRTVVGLLASPSSHEHKEVLRSCTEIAHGMRDSVSERIAQVRALKEGGQKSRDGYVFLGDSSGSYDFSTHLKVLLNVIASTLATGVLAGYPLYQQDLKEAGVFNHVCNRNETVCDAQDLALSNLYSNAAYIQLALMFVCGMWFDFFGPRASSTGGAVLSVVGILMLAVGVALNSKESAIPQYVLLYAGCVFADMGGSVASMGLLGWLWHYPKSQTLLIGLANATTQVAAALGVAVHGLVEQGFSLPTSFAIMSLTGVAAAVMLPFIVPTQEAFLAQAAKVMKVKTSSLVPANPSLRGFRLQVRNLLGCLRVFPDYNGLLYMCVTCGTVGYMSWMSSWATKYEDWFDKADALFLSNFFASTLPVAALLFNPLSGILMDKIGLPRFCVIVSFSAVGMAVTESIKTVSGQAAFMSWFALYIGTIQNVVGKWPVHFVPPTLFGITYGSLGFVGACLGGAFNVYLNVMNAGTLGDIPITLFLGASGIIFTFLTGSLLAKGVPRKAPRNRYDSRERCLIG